MAGSTFRPTDTPSDPTLYVVVTRVAERRNARQIDTLLRFAGERLRPGVFEVACTPAELQRLERALGAWVEDGDLVRIYPICARCRGRARLFGEGELAHLPVAWVL